MCASHLDVAPLHDKHAVALWHQLLEDLGEVFGYLFEGQLDGLIFPLIQVVHEVKDRLQRTKHGDSFVFTKGRAAYYVEEALGLKFLCLIEVFTTMGHIPDGHCRVHLCASSVFPSGLRSLRTGPKPSC